MNKQREFGLGVCDSCIFEGLNWMKFYSILEAVDPPKFGCELMHLRQMQSTEGGKTLCPPVKDPFKAKNHMKAPRNNRVTDDRKGNFYILSTNQAILISESRANAPCPTSVTLCPARRRPVHQWLWPCGSGSGWSRRWFWPFLISVQLHASKPVEEEQNDDDVTWAQVWLSYYLSIFLLINEYAV